MTTHVSVPCTCLEWSPAHEPKPVCSWGDGNLATHILLHKDVGHRCRHFVCPTHLVCADVVNDETHTAHALADLYPDHFKPEGVTPS
jgi:hypothetical protein